jgi:hypothetical protein
MSKEERNSSSPIRIRHPSPITVVELSATLTQEEIRLLREAITKNANEPDWQEAAIRYFASLRQRSARYQVKELARSYNAAL